MAAQKNEEITVGLQHTDSNLLTNWPQVDSNLIDTKEVKIKTNADLNSEIFNDTSVSDLIVILDEVKLHSGRVEAVNVRLKRDRQQLLKQIGNLQKEIASIKKNCEDILAEKTNENKKLKEEISNSFQENCSLKESTAHIRLENTQLKQELSNMKAENAKLHKRIAQLQAEQKGSNSIKIQRNNLGGRSKKLYSREELEEKFNHAHDIVKEGASNHSSSEFSLLGFDLSDEIQLKEISNCCENVTALKQELNFNNFTLKFLLHILQSHQHKNDFFHSNNQHFHQSFIPFSKSKAITKAQKLKLDILSSKMNCIGTSDADIKSKLYPEENSDIEADCVPCCAGKENLPSQISENKLDFHSGEQLVNSNSSFSKGYQISYPPEFIVNDNFLNKHHQTSYKKTTDQNIAATSSILNEIPVTLPLLRRSESSEVNVGSPPHSNLLLTPDSLLVGTVSPLSAVKNSVGNDCSYATSQSVPGSSDIDEERICPMCQVAFPKPVPQKDFENHVVGHFDVEEFELLNI